MNPPRAIVFQPQNHVGLGHTNRLAAIALALRRLDEGVRTPFVVEGAAHLLLDALGLPYVPLPGSHLLFETDNWCQWQPQERYDLQVRISRTVLESLQPRLVVFDFFPSEAFASAVIEKKIPIALCLRQTRHLDLQLQRMRILMPHVCRVLIPHEEGAFEVPDELRERSRFVGGIVRETPIDSDRSRQAGGFDVVIGGGGGGHPETAKFFNLAMQAIAEVRGTGVELRARLITGPLFTDWSGLEILPGITIVPFDAAIVNTMDAADLVICQAGYNTIAELERISARTIVVPGPRRWDDQAARAMRVAKENARVRVFSGSGAPELASEMTEFLRRPMPSIQKSRLDGAIRAAQELLELLK